MEAALLELPTAATGTRVVSTDTPERVNNGERRVDQGKAKALNANGSPLLISLVRFQIVGAFFYIPVFVMLHRSGQRLSRREWPLLVLLGLIGTTGSQVFFMIGLLTTPDRMA